jgi:hypothetical protein
MEEDQLAFGFGEVGFDGFDCFLGFLGRARCDVDFRIVGVEDLREFLANAAGGAGDDEDLWRLAWAQLNGWRLLAIPCLSDLGGFFL